MVCILSNQLIAVLEGGSIYAVSIDVLASLKINLYCLAEFLFSLGKFIQRIGFLKFLVYINLTEDEMVGWYHALNEHEFE